MYKLYSVSEERINNSILGVAIPKEGVTCNKLKELFCNSQLTEGELYTILSKNKKDIVIEEVKEIEAVVEEVKIENKPIELVSKRVKK
jgi:hypothetical protein